MVSTPLKNISQLGLLLPKYGKIKTVPNHQPVIVDNEQLIVRCVSNIWWIMGTVNMIDKTADMFQQIHKHRFFIIWLVVLTPSLKIWVRQWKGWHAFILWKRKHEMFQTTKQLCLFIHIKFQPYCDQRSSFLHAVPGFQSRSGLRGGRVLMGYQLSHESYTLWYLIVIKKWWFNGDSTIKP